MGGFQYILLLQVFLMQSFRNYVLKIWMCNTNFCWSSSYICYALFDIGFWKTIDEQVISNAMTVLLRHCRNNATKRDLGITNYYISN